MRRKFYKQFTCILMYTFCTGLSKQETLVLCFGLPMYKKTCIRINKYHLPIFFLSNVSSLQPSIKYISSLTSKVHFFLSRSKSSFTFDLVMFIQVRFANGAKYEWVLYCQIKVLTNRLYANSNVTRWVPLYNMNIKTNIYFYKYLIIS